MADSCTAVLDVGKTHAKLSLWGSDGRLLARRSHPNAPVQTPLYRALDAAGIEAWTAATLRDFSGRHRITTIVPTAHGAAAAVVRDGALAYPPIDYEQPIPAAIRERYNADRDDFGGSGSPALPLGLNLGVQFEWLEALYPDALGDGAVIVPWPQYWAYVLSGVAAAEVSSLGCHTDLWRPLEAAPSKLASSRGWSHRLAPLRRAGEILGTVRPEWVNRTGLSADTRVLCGLHDSNAALLAARGFGEIGDREATIVSTGTWFIAMRSTADMRASVALRPDRDCLVNVATDGRPVPSARFMGGRELELLTPPGSERADHPPDQARLLAAVAGIIDAGAMVLPSVVSGVGPFPHAHHEWRAAPTHADGRRVAAALYAALMLDTSLELVGATERILIEGRFADADVFVRAVASLRSDTEVYATGEHDSVPFGALRLIDPSLKPAASLRRVAPLPVDLSEYRAAWRRAAAALEAAA